MLTNPSSFTYEYLSSLKFKELQKLSVQFHVNKRWAKKQELIKNLLGLKENNCDENKAIDEKLDEKKEWGDGSTFFNDLQPNYNENEIDRRLTFNVHTKSDTESTTSRSTFDVPQNGKSLLSTNETFNSRETYEVAPSKMDFGIDSRATFEIPPKGELITEEEIDSRATFVIPQNRKELTENKNRPLGDGKSCEKIEITQNLNKTSEKIIKNAHKSGEKTKSEVKMLTIPYARVTRRTKRDDETLKSISSPMKLSKKSINIKKSVRLPASRGDLIKSPMFSSIKKAVSKQTIMHSLNKSQSEKITRSKIPTRLHFNEDKSMLVDKALNDGNKENVKKGFQKEKLRTANDAAGKKSNSLTVTFMSPPATLMKNKKVCLPLKKTPLRRETDNKIMPAKLNSTPGVKLTTKPITVTKMPDFSKIHQKQFEQMDSLPDYLKKKEERTRKLFGIPQSGTQLKARNNSLPLFQFQSSIEKGSHQNENLMKKTPLIKKEKDAKAAQREALRHKLKLQTDIKDKTRSYIHGVRTNKRFELQMKLRNICTEN